MANTTTESLFLKAFEGTNTKVPVWFMRQAGRYLPEYRALRERYSLNEMFDNPELAAQVTCLPIQQLDVDAAILFADILTLPRHTGFPVNFIKGKGPVIQNPLRDPGDIDRIQDLDDIPALRKEIQIINQLLPEQIPLVGFAGAPFTVLSYLVEGGSSTNFRKILSFANRHPQVFHQAMQRLTKNTIAYYQLQKVAGIRAFQLFDTWAGILRKTDYQQWVLPYVQEIFKSVDLPSIYYLKNCAHLLEPMAACGADVLSVCETVDLAGHPLLTKINKGIQGNLYQGLLYADQATLEKEVLSLLRASRSYKKYIFNLSHGIFPDTDVEKLKFVVDCVHQFSRGS